MRVELFLLFAVLSVSSVWTSEIDLKTFNGAGEEKNEDLKTEAQKGDEKPTHNLEEQEGMQSPSQALELDAITSTSHDPGEEAKRKKKSATTFCVEIRPSGAERPFEVCEQQGGRVLPVYPEQATYNDATAKHLIDPNQNKPTGAAYSSPPVKTFPVPSKPAYTTHQTYNNYRSGDGGKAAMRSADWSSKNEDDEDVDDDMDPELSAADPGRRSSSYNTYGSPQTSYVPMVPHQGYKHHGHNGLVITCQPNLAGYAHNVPSSYNHPQPNYQYRSSTPRHYGSYGRPYQSYRPQQQPYGAYKVPSKPVKQINYQTPAYKVPTYPSAPHDYKAPSQYKPQATSYQQQTYHAAPTYQGPTSTYQAPPSSSYQGPASTYQSPASTYHADYQAPAPTYQAPAGSYQAPAASSYHAPGPAPSYEASASSYHAPTPIYKAPAAVPTYDVPPPNYQAPAAPAYQAPQSYGSAGYQSAPSSYQSASSYTPPGNYRSAVDVDKKIEKPELTNPDGKKEQINKKMEEVYNEKAARSNWAAQMMEGKSANPVSEPDVIKDGQVKTPDTHLVGDSLYDIKKAQTDKKMEEVFNEQAARSNWATQMMEGKMPPTQGAEAAVSETAWKQRESEAKIAETTWKQREAEAKMSGTSWNQRESGLEMPGNTWKQREADPNNPAIVWKQREAEEAGKAAEHLNDQSLENQVI